ncbi:MAG TPA: hypothetical protein VJT54_13690, partial [Verrucomicrobiae bacterium]|nr:hypothetical protein [Verrucomicrobiae bacterium]
MNKNPGVSEMLALLDALKGAVENFAAREEKLNHDFEIRSAAELDAFESAKLEQQSKHAEALTAAEAALDEGRNRCNTRFEKRKVKINRAHSALSQRVLDEGSSREGELKQKIRKNSTAAEERRDNDLANATANFEWFQQKLNESNTNFRRLEKSARRAFRGYGMFRRLLRRHQQTGAADLSQDENQLFEEFQCLESKSRDDLVQFRKKLLPWIFRFLPVSLVVLLLLGVIAAVPVLQHFGRNTVSWSQTGPVAFVLLVIFILYFPSRRVAAPAAIAIAGQLGNARRLLDACPQKIAEHYQREQSRILAEFDATTRDLSQEWKRSVRQIVNVRGVRPMEVDQKALQAGQKNEQYRRAGFVRVESRHREKIAGLQAEAEASASRLAGAHAGKVASLESQHQTQWAALESEWKNKIEPLFAQIHAANAASDQLFPGWDAP